MTSCASSTPTPPSISSLSSPPPTLFSLPSAVGCSSWTKFGQAILSSPLTSSTPSLAAEYSSQPSLLPWATPALVSCPHHPQIPTAESVWVCQVHGQGEWIKLPATPVLDGSFYGDGISAVFCVGTFYCFCSGLFRVIDPLFPSPSIKTLDMKCPAGHLREAQNHYLVASNGEVLMVVVDGTGLSYDRIQDFRVFRADFSQMTWVIMKELGDRVLFVDEDFAFCLSTAEVGCKKNLIYYTYSDDYVGSVQWPPPLLAWKVFDKDARGWIDGPSFPNGVGVPMSTLWFVPSLEYVNPL